MPSGRLAGSSLISGSMSQIAQWYPSESPRSIKVRSMKAMAKLLVPTGAFVQASGGDSSSSKPAIAQVCLSWNSPPSVSSELVSAKASPVVPPVPPSVMAEPPALTPPSGAPPDPPPIAPLPPRPPEEAPPVGVPPVETPPVVLEAPISVPPVIMPPELTPPDAPPELTPPEAPPELAPPDVPELTPPEAPPELAPPDPPPELT